MKKRNVQNDIVSEKKDSPYYAFITFTFIIGLFIIDFLPPFNALENIEIQFLYLALLNLALGIFIYNNPEIREINLVPIFKNSTTFKFYVAFLILCGASLITSCNFSLSVIAWVRLLLGFCLFLNLIILLYNRLHLINTIITLITISTLLQAGLELYQLFKMANLTSLPEALSQFKGNTGNINIFSASMSVKIPFVLFGIISSSVWKKWLAFITFFLAISCIFLTRSRTAFISLSLETILFAIGYLYFIKKRDFKVIFVVFTLFFISFGATSLLIKKAGDTGRGAALARLANVSEDSSAQQRLALWKNAVEITNNNPFFGVGPGNWKVELLGYEKYLFSESVVSTHAHNDFFEVTAESGYICGIIFLSLFIIILFVNAKRVLKSKDMQTRMIAFLVFLSFMSYAIDSTFNFPLYRPTMHILFCLCIALTIVNTDKEEITFVKNKYKIGFLIFILVGIIFVYFNFLSFRASQLEAKITRDESVTAEEILSQLPKYPNIGLQSAPFMEYAGIKYHGKKDYKHAIDCFKISEKLNPYAHGDYYRAWICKDQGQLDSAYYYIRRAVSDRPKNTQYFRAAVEMAQLKKDTINILKLHHEFEKNMSNPINWVTTSNALYVSGYSMPGLIAFLNKGLKKFPNDNDITVRKLFYQAQAYSEKINYNLALETYKKIRKIAPKDILCIQNIGICYFNMGQYKTAIYYLEEAANSTDQAIKEKSEKLIAMCRNNIKILGK